MIRLKVLALDPGGHTGWALWDSATGKFSYGQLEDDMHHLALWDLMMNEDGFYTTGRVNDLLIICERFDHRNNQFAELISKEYIGIVHLYEQTMRRMVQRLKYPVVWVGSDKMRWATDEKLTTIRLMIRPKVRNKDALAAMRHLVGYICNYVGTDLDINRCKVQMLNQLKET